MYIKVKGTKDGCCDGCAFMNETGNCHANLPEYQDCGYSHIYVLDKGEDSVKIEIPEWLAKEIEEYKSNMSRFGVDLDVKDIDKVLFLAHGVAQDNVIELEKANVTAVDLVRAISEGYVVKYDSVKGYVHKVVEWTCPNCKTQSHDYEGDRYGTCPSCLTEFELEY